MAIEKMKLVSVHCAKEKYLELARCAIERKDYHPISASEVIKTKDKGMQYAQDQVYTQLKARIDALDKGLHLGLKADIDKAEEIDVETIKTILDKAEMRYQKFTSNQSRVAEAEDKLALKLLREYTKDDEHQYISVHLGRIPLEAVSRVTLYNNEPFIFTELTRNKYYAWIIYVCMKEDDDHFAEMFGSLYFEKVEISSDIETEEEVSHYCLEELDKVYNYVTLRSEMERFERYVSIEDEEIVFNAFVPEKQVAEVLKHFEKFDVKVDDENEYNLTPPTKLKNSKFVKPFEFLVEMYGLPKYGTFDPTTLFSITYSLLFGIMFGDLGQGLVISLLGWYVWKKRGFPLGAILFRIGLFSAFFGTIYGSVFGDETILKPILEPFGLPIEVGSNEMTQPLLIAAVVMGIVLILMSMVTNIIVLVKQKRYTKAIFDQNGLCGILFYGYLIIGAALTFIYSINVFTPPLLIIFIALPLLGIMFHEPISNVIEKRGIKPEEGWGSYITVGFFELFEVLLSFMANTLSFLRVGGFVLSHVGMMTVVIELRNLSGTAGILVMIFGNILVIGLEGMIVGIQALRLEYYEMFSRYYESGGIEYKTL